MAQKELMYKFQVNVLSEEGNLIKSIILDHWEFPSDEEIMTLIGDNGGYFAKVERIYWVDTIPFS